MAPLLLVLASGSRYRADVLRSAGYEVTTDPPDIDERSADHLFVESGAEVLAVELARRKVSRVAPRHPGSLVLAADQVGAVGEGPDALMLTKAAKADSAVEQLMAMSGTEHRLVNGLALLDTAAGRLVTGVDVQIVTMAHYDEIGARRYVERFEPWDTAGSYRLEDSEQMAPGEALVSKVQGEHDSGVLGMPLPLLERLVESLR